MLKMSFESLIKQRTVSVAKAFDAIERSKKILEALEADAVETAQGGFPDPGDIASRTHELREQVDQILVGLVEARAYYRGEREIWPPIQPMENKRSRE